MSDLFQNDHIKAALYLTDLGHYLLKYKSDQASGAVAVKNLREAEVRAAFTGLNADTGWVHPGMVRVGNSATGPFFVFYQPRVLREIQFVDGLSMNFYMPATMLIGAKDEFYLFALAKTNSFAKEEKLFHAPFPNVHSDGKICWGSNEKPKVDPSKAYQIWNFFFESPFNGELADGKSKEFPKDVREQIKKTGPVYTLLDMVPMPIKENLETITEKLIGGENHD